MESTQLKPSGSFLPAFIRRKWKEENEASADGTPPRLSEQFPGITRSESSSAINRIYTAKEIEERMKKISKIVLVDLQKQIQRGEESYYEETNGHGNLFRGWDAFVDSRDPVGSAGVSSMPQGGSRRIPADNRWFTSSGNSVARTTNRPPSWNRPLSAGPLNVPSTTVDPISVVATAVASSSSSHPSNVILTDSATSQSALQISSDRITDLDRHGLDAPPFVGSSITSEAAATQNSDVNAPEMPLKRKRQDDEQGDAIEGRDAKKRPSDGVGHERKDTPTDEGNESEEIEETPRTPVASKKEERTLKRTDSQTRRSSRRKAN